MHPELTYELRVSFADAGAAATQVKQDVIEWLLLTGIESFVEGELSVDINQNQDEPPRDYYTELGGDLTPMSIYRYSRDSLEDLETKLTGRFGSALALELRAMATETWMNGWKESFRPFATREFWVRPPWEPAGTDPALIDLVIEPGMAFGTGQHATTRLCLSEVGADAQEFKAGLPRRRVLDVGTGTGILAIGALKLGYAGAMGTDIEDDALLAARENARLNQVELPLLLGSLPRDGALAYDLVIANILAVVILRLMDELAAAVAPGGRLLLSGILAEEVAEVAARGGEAGLREVRRSTHEGWASLVLAKS